MAYNNHQWSGFCEEIVGEGPTFETYCCTSLVYVIPQLTEHFQSEKVLIECSS